MLRRISIQSGEKHVVNPEEENEIYDGKNLQKREVLGLE